MRWGLKEAAAGGRTRVLERVRRFLEQKLKLKVNEPKSKEDRPAQRKFLGFRLFKRKGVVMLGGAKRARERYHERLHPMARRTGKKW